MSLADNTTDVSLVVCGYKQLALINKEKDPIGFELALNMGSKQLLAVWANPTEDSTDDDILITQIENTYAAERFFWLVEEGMKELCIKGYYRAMGELFNYTDREIEWFVSKHTRCICTKCRGH